MNPQPIIDALSESMLTPLRWAGSVAQRLRQFNIALEGKSSGSALTDALTLADLTLQELLVAALRDSSPIFRQCRIEAEETTGDLVKFPKQAEWTLALDPIDGTKQYRDKTGNGYCVMLHLRNATNVVASFVYVPEKGPQGWWVACTPDRLVCGSDDLNQTANQVINSLPAITPANRPATSRKIYLIGFQSRDVLAAQQVTAAGLEGVAPDDMPGSIYELMASGEFGGSLIHSPNLYDFPVSLQIARHLGGDAVWVHNGEPVHFRETWLDDRADMLRLPGIVACSPNREILATLCHVAKNWNTDRYHTHAEL